VARWISSGYLIAVAVKLAICPFGLEYNNPHEINQQLCPKEWISGVTYSVTNVYEFCLCWGTTTKIIYADWLTTSHPAVGTEEFWVFQQEGAIPHCSRLCCTWCQVSWAFEEAHSLGPRDHLTSLLSTYLRDVMSKLPYMYIVLLVASLNKIKVTSKMYSVPDYLMHSLQILNCVAPSWNTDLTKLYAAGNANVSLQHNICYWLIHTYVLVILATHEPTAVQYCTLARLSTKYLSLRFKRGYVFFLLIHLLARNCLMRERHRYRGPCFCNKLLIKCNSLHAIYVGVSWHNSFYRAVINKIWRRLFYLNNFSFYYIFMF
jgi:hypothetical protein